MVYRYSSRDIGKDRVAVFVNGEEEISSRRQADSRYVFAMGEWERIGFVSVKTNLLDAYNSKRVECDQQKK